MPINVKGSVDGIAVGRSLGDDSVFIGVPGAMYEDCTLPLSGKRRHVFRFSEDDVRWLIGTLRKELAHDPDGDENDYMDERFTHHATPFTRQLGSNYRLQSLETFKGMWHATQDDEERRAIEAAMLILTADLSSCGDLPFDWDLPCLCHECSSC